MSPERLSRRRAMTLLPVAAVSITALGVRVAAVMLWSRNREPHGDEAFYWRQAQALGRGAGVVVRNNFGEQMPTAVHPPLYSAYLGLVGLLRFPESSHLPYRLATALLGAAAAALVALVALRLAGRRAGVVAGLLAAVYPNLWFNDAKLTAESMYALTIAGMLLSAHAYRDRPSARLAALLGAAIGVAALARAEAFLLFGLVLLPVVWFTGAQSVRTRLSQCAIGLAVGAAVLAPWLVRNLTSFQHRASLSSATGFVIEISNCDESFGVAPPAGASAASPPAVAPAASVERGAAESTDRYLGYWASSCDRSDAKIHGAKAVPWPAGDETVIEAWKRRIGLDYVSDHRDRLPVVLLARTGRIWDVWRPGQSVELNSFFEGRDAQVDIVGRTLQWQAFAMAQYYVLLGLGAVGLVTLRRMGSTLVPYAALAISATLTALVSFGITRYRVGVDVALCVLAGVAVDALWSRWARRMGRPAMPMEADA